MAILTDSVGQELEAQLPTESALRRHGSLTIALIQALEGIDPTQRSVRDLESSVRDLAPLSFQILCDAEDSLLLSSPSPLRGLELIGQLEELRLRQTIETLGKVIARREAQDDYWPEGRLTLGIAYAAKGDYDTARRWLEEAVAILSGRGLAEDGYQMAM